MREISLDTSLSSNGEEMTGTEFQLRFYTGKQAAALGPELWAALDERRQRTMFWDAQPEQKQAMLSHDLAKADVVGVATQGGAVLAYAWVGTVIPKSRVGHGHFAFTGEVIDEVSTEFWAGIKSMGIYDSVIAIQPLAYRGAREHAIKHGFNVLGNIPGLIVFANRPRPATGVILVKDMRGDG